MEFLIGQLYTFVIMFVFGIVLGMAFNFYQWVLKRLKVNKIWVNIIDLFLGVAIGVAAFIILLFTNLGEVRYYVLLGVSTGLLSYFYIGKKVNLFK